MNRMCKMIQIVCICSLVACASTAKKIDSGARCPNCSSIWAGQYSGSGDYWYNPGGGSEKTVSLKDAPTTLTISAIDANHAKVEVKIGDYREEYVPVELADSTKIDIKYEEKKDHVFRMQLERTGDHIKGYMDRLHMMAGIPVPDGAAFWVRVDKSR